MGEYDHLKVAKLKEILIDRILSIQGDQLAQTSLHRWIKSDQSEFPLIWQLLGNSD